MGVRCGFVLVQTKDSFFGVTQKDLRGSGVRSYSYLFSPILMVGEDCDEGVIQVNFPLKSRSGCLIVQLQRSVVAESTIWSLDR